MIYQKYFDNPQNYLFRYVLVDHADEYVEQGWEIVGTMQNTLFALNSVTSYIMAFQLK